MQVITIDGPASSGKGTVAKIIAKKLGYHYLESGAIYRALGLLVLRRKFNISEIDKITAVVDEMDLQFLNGNIYLNEEDVTFAIRDEQIGMLASNLAKLTKVRAKLLNFQHTFAREPGLVTDGRDMGSIIFPNAFLKIFLTASAEKRMLRRYSQLQLVNKPATMEAILRDIIARDKQDSERSVAPLSYNESFKVLDNSTLSIEETVEQILNWFTEKTSN